jgi:hypothetical protein
MKSRKLFCPGYLPHTGETRNMYMILAEKSLEKYLEEGAWKVVVRETNADVNDVGSGSCTMIDFIYC